MASGQSFQATFEQATVRNKRAMIIGVYLLCIEVILCRYSGSFLYNPALNSINHRKTLNCSPEYLRDRAPKIFKTR
jgi:hypothetical protein